MIALRALIFTVLAPGSVTILIPYLLLSSSSNTRGLSLGNARLLGLLPLLVGIAFYLRCLWDFVVSGKGTPDPAAPPRELVVNGLYRYSRNPMYVGLLLVLIGEGLFFESLLLLLYAALLFFIVHMRVIFYEEPTLQKLFGESYARYCKEVPRWLFFKL